MKKVVFILLLLCTLCFTSLSLADGTPIDSGKSFGLNTGGFKPVWNPGDQSPGSSNPYMNGSGQGGGVPSGNNEFNNRTGLDSSSALFFEPAPGDMSMTYLGDIFGNVGTTVSGNGPPIVGELFGVFNTALIGLALMIIGYLVFRGVMDTAAQGEFLGKEFNSVWVPLRTVLGIVLLIPRKAGYCLAQLVIMQIIVMGVGVADTAWDTALDYFQNGGGLLPVNVSSTASKPGEAGSLAYEEQHQALVDNLNHVFASLVCMKSLAKNENIPFTPPIYTAPIAPSTIAKYTFSLTTPATPGPPPLPATQVSCGTVTWDTANTSPDANGLITYGSGSIPAMQSIIDTLTVYAGFVVNGDLSNPNPDIAKANAQKVYGEIGSNFIDNMAYLYQETIQSVITQGPTDQNNAFMNNARNRGWAAAGIYAHDMMTLDNKITKVQPITAPGPDPKNPAFQSGGLYSAVGVDIGAANVFVDTLEEVVAATESDGSFFLTNPGGHLLVPATHRYWDAKKARHVTTSDASGCITYKYWHDVKGIIHHTKKTVCPTSANSMADNIYDALNDSMSTAIGINAGQVSGQEQPLLAMQNVGQGLVNLMGQLVDEVVAINGEKKRIAETGSLGAGFLGMVPIVGPSLSAIETAQMTAELSELATYQGFLIAVFTGLAVPAAMLAVYIPMLPYMLFVIGVLGWVLTVFESMVAAPIVALGIIHPEGHSVYGKSEPTAMILVSVFIKPILMVIGLIAAIVIADTTAWFVNVSLYYVVQSTFGAALAPTQNIVAATIFEFFIIFVYMALMLALVNKCFQLIYVIPDKVMRWLTGGVAMDQGEGQVLGEVKSQYSQDVGEAKGIAGKGMETSVAQNDAQNKKTQEQIGAGFGIAKGLTTGASDSAGSPGGSSDGGESGPSAEEMAMLL